MEEPDMQLPRQPRTRRALRLVGLAVLSLGGLLTLIGMGSFFASFGSFGPPRFFWCAFLGMPLLFVGGAMTMFGFMGAVQRYVAGESVPVAKDVINYMGRNTQPGVKAIARAVTQGIKEGLDESPTEEAGGVDKPAGSDRAS